MKPAAATHETVSLSLPDEAATGRLAGRAAEQARRGDVVALIGDLGAGKTAFARAFIGRLAGAQEVPSPTFTLVQTYDTPVAVLWHFDLYRLSVPDEALELGIEDAFSDGIALIEWPDRLGPLLPEDRLDVVLAFEAGRPEARTAVLTGRGSWARRLPLLTHHA